MRRSDGGPFAERRPTGNAVSRWLRLSVGLCSTAGFAWLLARGLEGDALIRAFSGVSVSAVVLALAFMFAGHAARIGRWWWMLRALEPGLPFGACVRPFLASIALNNVLPLRAGDALRVLGFRRQLRSPATRVLGTLVIERALDLVFLSGIFFVGLLGLPEGVFPRGFVVAAAALAAAGTVTLLASMLLPLLLERFGDRLPGRRLLAGILARPRWRDAASKHGAHLAAALGLMRSGRRTLALAAWSAAVWILEGAVFVTMAGALAPGVAPPGPWLSLATGTLATALPSSPGYVGTFDYFAAAGLAAYGAAPAAAAAFALTVHALWIPLTAVGLLCYWLPAPARRQRLQPGGE